MKRMFGAIIVGCMLFSIPVLAASTDETTYLKGKVESVSEEGKSESGDGARYHQQVSVKLNSSERKGEVIKIQQEDSMNLFGQRARRGEWVIVAKVMTDGDASYYIADKDRTQPLAAIFLVFVAIAAAFGGKKGIMSFAGLAVTIGVLAWYIVPRIIAGENPLFVTMVGACVMATASIFLAHGYNRRIMIAVAATLLTLLVSGLAASLAVAFAKLYGTGTEEALFAQTLSGVTLDLRGLLLSGIIIGTLGVLDDITTAQAAVVEEIKRADPSLSVAEVYRRGISVGKEHIASLVNTLVLAYAGASLPLFVLFAVNGGQPMWVTVSSEFVAEEIVRTLVGSAALIIAVPVATYLAAKYIRLDSEIKMSGRRSESASAD